MPSLTRHGHSRTARSSVHGVSTGLPGSFVVTGGPRPPGKRGNVCWDGRAGGTFFAPAGCAAFGVVAVPAFYPSGWRTWSRLRTRHTGMVTELSLSAQEVVTG